MSEQTAAPAAGGGTSAVPPGRTGIGRKNVMDMVRSLALIGGMVAIIYLLVPQTDVPVVQPVDLQDAAEAAQGTDVPVVVPDLPADWQVTSARRDRPVDAQPATWHVGYLTPSQGYAGLEVADDVDPTWVERVTSDGTEAGTQDVDGTPWRVFESQDPPRTSLLLEQDGRTTVVTGSAVLDELVQLAAAASRS